MLPKNRHFFDFAKMRAAQRRKKSEMRQPPRTNANLCVCLPNANNYSCRMKHLFLFALLSFFASAARAQSAPKPWRAIVQTGIAFQWFNPNFRTALFSVERPHGPYQCYGVQLNIHSPQPDYDDFYGQNMLRGYEVGFFGKYFLHGRLTGRNSGFFLGPDFRFGKRVVREHFFDTFPPNPEAYRDRDESAFKILLRWGVQWRFGRHALLEMSAPLGIEHRKIARFGSFGTVSGYQTSGSLVLLPTLQLGMGF
jgi:hypothetical protein